MINKLFVEFSDSVVMCLTKLEYKFEDDTLFLECLSTLDTPGKSTSTSSELNR